MTYMTVSTYNLKTWWITQTTSLHFSHNHVIKPENWWQNL